MRAPNSADVKLLWRLIAALALRSGRWVQIASVILESMPSSSSDPDSQESSKLRRGSPFTINPIDCFVGSVPTTPVILDFEMHDPAALSELLTHRLAPIVASSDGSQAGAAIGTYASHGGIFVSRVQFTGIWTYDFPRPFDGMIFYLPTHGEVHAELTNGSVVGTASTAIAIEASQCRHLTFTGNFARRAIAVPRRVLSDRLVLQNKCAPGVRPIFQTKVEATTSGMRALQTMIDFATSTDFGLALNDGTLQASALRESLLDFLFEAWPHDDLKPANPLSRSVMPRHVKLATDYITANPTVSVNGPALAAMARVSLRTLQEGFIRFVGMPIAVFHRRIRLQCAYDDLVARPTVPIEEIARKWGFTNSGRFTKYFRETYGTHPFEVPGRDPLR